MNDLPNLKSGGSLPDAPSEAVSDATTRYSLIGIFILLFLGFLFLARDFLVPISIAILLALVLTPVVRWLRRRGIPPPVSALALVVMLMVGFVAFGYLLSGPVATVVADAPRIGAEIQKKFWVLRGPMEAIGRATAGIEELVSSDDDTEKVVVDGGSGAILGSIATDAGQRLAATALCLILLLFILGSGDLFLEKLIKVMPTLSDKKFALRIARDIEQEVSRYLLTVTAINVGLGIVVGVAFWLLGMPSPLLWAIFTTLANFIPFIGAAIVALSVFGLSIVAFDTLSQALLPTLVFLSLTALEGQIITPLILGRRHALNAVAIVASVAFWGWIWGIIGALIAVPLLVTVKVFADHVELFRPIGEFLSARDGLIPASNGEEPEGEGGPLKAVSPAPTKFDIV
jgi:predicted PurR-regulated permease PerM